MALPVEVISERMAGYLHTDSEKIGMVAEGRAMLALYEGSGYVYRDFRLMRRIALAESSLSHYNRNGTVKRGYENPDDIGLFQINQAVWGEEARRLGYDIYEPMGNVLMAMYIRSVQGLSAWSASRNRWQI